MAGIADWQAQITIDVDDLKKKVKAVEGELDGLVERDYKVKLDLDTKTLESAVKKLDKMLDSIGKGSSDFKQFENLSKELSSIAIEVQSLSKAFGKVDDSGAKTLLSSIQNIDRSLSDLSQNILNVNKNMSNMGGNTSGAVRQVENIGNAAADAVKQVDKLADAQGKLGNKTNISLGDSKEQSTEIDLYHILEKRKITHDEIIDRIQTIISLKEKEKSLSKISDDTELYDSLYDENDINWASDKEGTINRISDRLKEIYSKYDGKISLIDKNDIQEAVYLLDILKGAGESPNLNKSQEKFYQNKKFSDDSLFENLYVDSQKAEEIDKINTELSETYRWFNQLEGVSFDKNIANAIKSLISDMQIGGKTASEYANDLLKIFNIEVSSNSVVEEQNKLQSELKEAETQAEKTAQAVKEVSSATPEKDLKDAIQGNGSEVSVAQKIADNFEEVKQNTDKATESAKDYIRVLSQVGELGVDAKVSAMYQRNDGQLESVSWRAKRDDQGQILYDKNGNVDYEEPVMTVISKYEQLEKIIIKADNELRDLQKTLSDTQSLDPTASTTNIEKQIQYQKDYIQLLEQTVKTISQQDEYLLYEQQIIDARNKAENEYNLKQGTKSDVSNAKQLASEEQKRQKNIEQTNRLLNRQQITIDTIEKSYNKIVNPDLDKSVSDTSDLIELSKKKSEIQNLINQLNGQSRNSSNEQEFLQLEKLISEYKQLAKDKLKANNPSKQELGGQDLTVLLEQQVAQYNQLITKAEKYGDATSDIVDKLKTQRDLIAQANSDGVYTAKSGLKADDYYSARDNYKIGKAQFSSYETDIKNTEKLIQAQKELGEATTKARQAVKDSTQSSVDNALKEQVTAWKNIQSIREKIAKTKDTDEITNLQQIKKEYQQNYIEADRILKANSSLYDKEIQVAKLEQIRVETNKKIADYNDRQVSGFDKRISGYESKLTSYQATANKFKDGGWTSDAYTQQIEKLNKTIGEYKTLLASMQNDSGLVTDKNIEQLNKYESEIKEVISTVSNMSAAEKGFSFLSAQKELDKINNILKEHSGMSREAKNQIRAYYAQIKSGNPSASLDVIHAEIMKIVNAEVEAGRAGKSMFAAIKEKAWYGVASAIGTYFGINDIFRYVGQGVNTIRELDEAMTEVRKVSEGTEAQYKSFQQTVSATAKEIASTNKELLNSSADFLRLGYSLEQAESLAKNATLFVNVGDGVDITEATEDMITAMKAFDIKAEDSIKIVDDYNQIGNKFALSATDIGEAMKRSASALETGNNSFEESIALITAMNEIVQSSENTGNTLKVFSLRLRGAKAELEDMGEDTDGLCESSSKLREQLQALTGVDIMLDDNTFKSTTQIVKELGAAWSKLSDSSQAATLELVAGKTRANNVAALLKNYKQIDNVLESLGEAEGSALRENDAIVDSINGRIKILSASMENFWQTAIDDSVIKNGVSALTSLVEGATNLVDTFGLLPPILTAVSAALSIKNIGRDIIVIPQILCLSWICRWQYGFLY